jgi:hypothetical protein
MGSPGVGHSMSHGLLGLNPDLAEHRTPSERDPACCHRPSNTRHYIRSGCQRIRPQERALELENILDQFGGDFLARGANTFQLELSREAVGHFGAVREVQPLQLIEEAVQVREPAAAFSPNQHVSHSMGNLGNPGRDRHRQGRETQYVRPGFTFPRLGAQGSSGQPPSECLQLPSPSTVYPFQPLSSSS